MNEKTYQRMQSRQLTKPLRVKLIMEDETGTNLIEQEIDIHNETVTRFESEQLIDELMERVKRDKNSKVINRTVTVKFPFDLHKSEKTTLRMKEGDKLNITILYFHNPTGIFHEYTQFATLNGDNFYFKEIELDGWGQGALDDINSFNHHYFTDMPILGYKKGER